MDKKNKTGTEQISQKTILQEYFLQNSNRNINHPEIVDWVVSEYLKRTGKVFRDPDRGIRMLFQKGFLIKVKAGTYKYDPNFIKNKKLYDFSAKMKNKIFERDGYRCVVCGNGRSEGVDIHADHIKPKDVGGKGTLQNGQTLCGPHNYLKKNFKQTETGKRLFIRLYELAKTDKNEKLSRFCKEILDVFEKNGINGHIEWKK